MKNKNIDIINIHDAAMQGNIEELKKCIKLDIDINSRDKEGGTALHYAAVNGHKEIVKCCIEHGANIDAEDTFSITPLMEVSRHNNLEMISLLVELGADVNKYNYFKPPPIFHAAVWGKHEAVQLLLNLGARLDIKDRAGSSVLFWAVGGGLRSYGQPNPNFYGKSIQDARLEIAKIFIKNGLSINEENELGHTPITEANEQGFWNIVRYFDNIQNKI